MGSESKLVVISSNHFSIKELEEKIWVFESLQRMQSYQDILTALQYTEPEEQMRYILSSIFPVFNQLSVNIAITSPKSKNI